MFMIIILNDQQIQGLYAVNGAFDIKYPLMNLVFYIIDVLSSPLNQLSITAFFY